MSDLVLIKMMVWLFGCAASFCLGWCCRSLQFGSDQDCARRDCPHYTGLVEDKEDQ